ncbi:MAG: hypothetical protein QXM96_00240 [Candidatus Woesearchaeota archaeon]
MKTKPFLFLGILAIVATFAGITYFNKRKKNENKRNQNGENLEDKEKQKITDVNVEKQDVKKKTDKTTPTITRKENKKSIIYSESEKYKPFLYKTIFAKSNQGFAAIFTKPSSKISYWDWGYEDIIGKIDNENVIGYVKSIIYNKDENEFYFEVGLTNQKQIKPYFNELSRKSAKVGYVKAKDVALKI